MLTNISYMFNECTSLISLNLYNNNVNNMIYIFNKYSSLTSLNLFNFNNKNVKDMKVCLV